MPDPGSLLLLCLVWKTANRRPVDSPAASKYLLRYRKLLFGPKSADARGAAVMSVAVPLILIFFNHSMTKMETVGVCIFLFFCFFYSTSGWSIGTDLPPKTIALRTTITIILFAAISIFLAIFDWPVPVPEETPTIMVRYSPSILPFGIPAGSTVNLLKFNRRIDSWTDEIPNLNISGTVLYPPGLVRRKDEDKEYDFYIAEFENHGEKDLVNIQIDFPTVFNSIENVPASGKNIGKECRVTISTPPAGHIAWYHRRPYPDCRVEGFISGQPIQAQDRLATIASLEKHHKAYIYLVNTSHYPVRFEFPTEGTAVVAGSKDARKVTFIKPEVGPGDSFAASSLPPGKYKWPFVQDDSK
jgi:hypothetical protein